MHTVKNIFCLIVLCFTTWNATAQIQFQRTFGIGLYNEGRCVKQTFDGGYIVAGTASDAGVGSADFYLLKTDSLGNFQWHFVYGGNQVDRSFSVLQSADSGYVVCGYTGSFGTPNNYDGYLLKTNTVGDTLWTKTFGGSDWDFLHAMVQTPDAGFLLAGNSYSNFNGHSEAYLVKTDSTGTMQWEKSLNLVNEVFINAIAITPEGNFVLAGYTSNLVNSDEDLLIIQTNPAGDTLWTKTIGLPTKEERAYSIDVGSADSSIVAGGYKKDLDSSYTEGYFIKMNASGNFIYDQLLSGTTGDNVIHDIHFNYDSLYGAGYTSSFGAGGKDFHYYTFNPGGYFVNHITTTHGGIDDEIAYHIETTSDGGYIMCGSSTSYTPGLQSLYLIKLDSLFITTSLVIGVDEPDRTSTGHSVYPNPFHESTTLQFDPSRLPGIVSLSVFNLPGQQVLSAEISSGNEFNITLDGLPSGMYIYRLSHAERLIGYGKLLLY